MTGHPAVKERIRMLTAGNWNSYFKNRNIYYCTRGFTLIELTMVILLFGLFVSFAIPRLQESLLTDDLKRVSRKITGTIKEVKNMAVRDQRDYYLRFDLESNRLWIDSPLMSEEKRAMSMERSYSLPEGIRIIDVWLKGSGEKTAGSTSIRFTKKGYIQPSAIHLGSRDGRNFTLLLSPFLGKVELMDSYVKFEDM